MEQIGNTTSHDHLTELFRELQDRGTVLHVFEASLFIIVALAAFCGNLLVCWAIYNNRRLRTIPNMFVASLALSDICMSSLVMPLTIGVVLYGDWIYTTAACLYQGYMIFVFGMVSLHTLMAISINRYFVIVRPNSYKKIFTKKRTMYMIIGVWIVAFLISIMPLAVPSLEISFHPGKCVCMYFFESNIAYTLFLEIVFIGTPMNIMLVCYSKVLISVRQNNKRIAAMKTERRSTVNVEEVKITNNLAVVLLGFVTCWGIIGVIDFIDLARGSPTLARQVYFTYLLLVFISSGINPFIYGIMNKKFRQEYKRFIFCRRRAPGEDSESSRTAGPSQAKNISTVTVQALPTKSTDIER